MMEKYFELEFSERTFEEFRLAGLYRYTQFRTRIHAMLNEDDLLDYACLSMDTADNFFHKRERFWKDRSYRPMYLLPNLFIKSYRNFDKDALIRFIWKRFEHLQASSPEELSRKANSIIGVFGLRPFYDENQHGDDCRERPISTPFSFRPCAVYEIEGLGNERKMVFSPAYEPPNTRDFFIRIEYEVTFPCGSAHLVSSIMGSPKKLHAYYKNPALYEGGFVCCEPTLMTPLYDYAAISAHSKYFFEAVVGETKEITLLHLSSVFQVAGIEELLRTPSSQETVYRCSPTIRHRKTDWSVVKQNIFDI